MPRLASGAELRARARRENAVAGAVDEKSRADRVPGLRRQLPCADGDDARAIHLRLGAGAVEKGREPWLEEDFSIQDAIPDRVIAAGIAILVLELSFFEYPCLLVVRAVRAADPHPDFR